MKKSKLIHNDIVPNNDITPPPIWNQGVNGSSSYFGFSPIIEKLFESMWLVFVLAQIRTLFSQELSPYYKTVAVILVFAFVVGYIILIWRNRPSTRSSSQTDLIILVILIIISLSMNLSYGSSWMELFFFVGCISGLRFPVKVAIWIISGMALLAIGMGSVIHASIPTIAVTVIVDFGLGFSMIGFVKMGTTIQQLREAREQIVQLAASKAIFEERLRFSRDLHDLLGHSLSLITLKSELSGRLVKSEPLRAQAEIQDVELVAREALREVRQAVLNYRQPTFILELESAKEMLAAAGVACNIEYIPEDLPPSIDAVLAWTVREAVTNIIRHAHATLCEIIISRSNKQISAMITNDIGHPSSVDCHPPFRDRHGSGLAGLEERIFEVHGELKIIPNDNSHFCLQAFIPIDNEMG